VRLAPEDDNYLAARSRDTRGLAKALIGDTQGAIEDFEAVIASDMTPREIKAQQQEWVGALRKGQQPFTPQLLEKLRSQETRPGSSLHIPRRARNRREKWHAPLLSRRTPSQPRATHAALAG